MRKKNLWKKSASIAITAAMIMTSVPVYAAGPDESAEEVVVQETTEEAEDEAVGILLEEEPEEEIVGEQQEEGKTSGDTPVKDYTFEVRTEDDLINAMQATIQKTNDNQYAMYKNLTVNINEDINLTGNTWTSGYFNGYGGAEVYTINGNNHTLTNLPGALFSGTWAGSNSKLIIKNLTIANSTMTGGEADTKGFGAFVGNTQATSNVELNKCHLLNCTIIGEEWTGGLIGYAGGYSNENNGPVHETIQITNCSVKNSEIQGAGATGAIFGHATGDAWTDVKITNCTVKGNKITCTDNKSDKAGSVMGTVGAGHDSKDKDGNQKPGGVTVTSAEVCDNTVVSDEVANKRIAGRFGSAGTLTIDGGSYDCTRAEAFPTDKGTLIVTGNPVFQPVASIGATSYDSLQEAVNAAGNGETIKLLKDINLGDSCINTNKNFTLDLAGNKLESDGSIALRFSGNAIIKDSSEEKTGVVSSKAFTVIVENGGTLSFTGGTIKDADYGIYVQTGGSLNMEAGTVKGNDYGIVVVGTDTLCSLSVSGGNIIAGGYAISGNGTCHNTKITITGGNIQGDELGIYHPQNGEMKISGGTINGNTGIEIRAGVVDISGGSITGNGIPTSVLPNGNGSTTNGAGVAIAQHTTKLPIDVTVSDGTISGYTALYESNPQNNEGENVNKISMSIVGGDFKAINGGVNAVYSENKTGFISGGTYLGSGVLTSIPGYIASGYELAKISTDTYQVVPKTFDKKDAIESATAVVKNGESPVAEDVTVTMDGYTLKVAGKISDGNKVKLTYNSVFGATGSVEITKSGDAFSAFPSTIILEEGVEYKVDVSGLETLPKNTILQSAGVETKVDNSLEGEEKEAAEELAEKLGQKDAVTTTGLAAVASEKITDNGTVSTSQGEIKTTDGAVQKKFEDKNINITNETVQLVVSPYLDIQITAVDTNTSDNKQTVTLNITPMYVVKATTAATAGEMVEEGVDTNTVTITDPQPLTVNETVTITLPLPTVFTEATPIYVKHKKENGRTYYYVTTISEDENGNSKEISFVNPNGFSDFTLEQDGREGWIDFEGVGIVKYNLSKMGDNLPTPTAPSGKYFINWTITDVNKNYTTNILTNELLTAIDDKTLTAAPNFGTYPSGPSIPEVTSVTISGISVEDKVYDGKEAAYAGTPSAVASDGTAVTIAASDYTYTWYNEDGTVLTAAPKDAGEYKLVVGVNNGTYTGSQTVAFKISKKEVTVSIDNKTMVQGEVVPELTVSYTGFVGTDGKDNALEVQAELATEADGKTAGEYDITFKTQPTLNDTVGKNYTLKYADKGTLKVEEKKVSAPQVLFAKASAGKNSVKLSWNKISGAEGYLIYGSRCGNSFKLLKKVSAKTLSYEKTKLAKGVFYKFYVAAYKTVDGEREVIVKSPQLHVTTKGGKYGNPTAVTVSKESVTVAKGKTTKVTAKVSKTDGKVKYHVAEIRYLSTNKKVATVTSKGTIKGVGKGTCYVYCYTQNGVVKKVKVTVK